MPSLKTSTWQKINNVTAISGLVLYTVLLFIELFLLDPSSILFFVVTIILIVLNCAIASIINTKRMKREINIKHVLKIMLLVSFIFPLIVLLMPPVNVIGWIFWIISLE